MSAKRPCHFAQLQVSKIPFLKIWVLTSVCVWGGGGGGGDRGVGEGVTSYI